MDISIKQANRIIGLAFEKADEIQSKRLGMAVVGSAGNIDRRLRRQRQRGRARRAVLCPRGSAGGIRLRQLGLTMKNLRMACMWAATAAWSLAVIAAQQQDRAAEYPNKPVRLIVTFAPGASNDILARLVAAKLTDAWGRNFIVDNRAGAGGAIGAATVAKAAPDGYTLLLANSGPSVGNPLLTKNASYSPRDFTNIVYIGYAPLVILANPAFAPKTPRELVDYAKANPGKISWGSSGIGTSPHIAILLFQSATGVRVNHIPYKGAVPNMADLLAGQIDVIYTTTVSSEPQIKANRVRGIGVASATGVRLLPDVPTLAEFGIRDAEAQIWYGLQGPLNVPASIVGKLNAEVNKALRMPDVKARLDQLGFEIAGDAPKDFDAVVKREIGRIEKLLGAGLLRKD